MGLVDASEHLKAVLAFLFKESKLDDHINCIAYIDDIIITSSSSDISNYVDNLSRIFKTFSKYNVRLALAKSEIMVTTLTFLGEHFSLEQACEKVINGRKYASILKINKIPIA